MLREGLEAICEIKFVLAKHERSGLVVRNLWLAILGLPSWEASNFKFESITPPPKIYFFVLNVFNSYMTLS